MEILIVLLFDRQLLEKIENSTFENVDEMITQLKSWGMTEEQEDSLKYYKLAEFTELVNDQVLDDLTETFIGYVKLNK